MKVGSLFSGYGGLDLAVERHFNAETVWHAEWEDAPSKVLAHRWPGVPNFRDVTQVDWSSVEPVDIITGGFPCQDVSMAGKRAGMVEGTRSNLWGAMRTAVETIRPRYVVAENVRGLLSATAQSDSDLELDQGFMGDGSALNLRAIGRVLGDLADIGYDAQWYGLRAADIGAPHGRYRVFILATDATTAPYAAHDRYERGEQVRSLSSRLGSQSLGKANSSKPCSFEKVSSRTAWGAYETAIRRWEAITGRPVPEPTEPAGRDGKPQLSAKFTEWMMGLDEGWVTDVPGVSRAQKIKMCGNGVVPQQALAALQHMTSAMLD